MHIFFHLHVVLKRHTHKQKHLAAALTACLKMDTRTRSAPLPRIGRARVARPEYGDRTNQGLAHSMR